MLVTGLPVVLGGGVLGLPGAVDGAAEEPLPAVGHRRGRGRPRPLPRRQQLAPLLGPLVVQLQPDARSSSARYKCIPCTDLVLEVLVGLPEEAGEGHEVVDDEDEQNEDGDDDAGRRHVVQHAVEANGQQIKQLAREHLLQY